MRETYEKKWQARRFEVGYDPDEHEEYNTYAVGEDLSGFIDFDRLLEMKILDWHIN